MARIAAVLSACVLVPLPVLAQTWGEIGESAGGDGLSQDANTGVCSTPSLAASPDGRIYVAYVTIAQSGFSVPKASVYVRTFDADTGAWIGMGKSAKGRGLSGDVNNASDPVVALDGAGRPVVAWASTASLGSGPQIFLKRWDGDSWVALGKSAEGGGISSATGGTPGNPSLAIDALDQPIVAWEQKDPLSPEGDTEIYLRQWSQAGQAWIEPGGSSASGGGVSDTQDNSARPRVAAGAGGAIFVAWCEVFPLNGSEIYAKAWNGSKWGPLGRPETLNVSNSSGPSQTSRMPSLALDGSGAPMVAWREGSEAILLRTWNGTGWADLGGSGSGAGIGSGTTPSLAAGSEGRPLVAWSTAPFQGSSEIQLRLWDGASWIGIGGSDTEDGISTTPFPSEVPSLAFADGRAIVAWQEDVDQEEDQIYLRAYFNSVPETEAGQYRTDGQPIPSGGFTALDGIAEFRVRNDDAEGVVVRIEVREVGEEFTGEATIVSEPVAPGGEAVLRAEGLADSVHYQWRHLAQDVLGLASPWTSFGGGDGETDFWSRTTNAVPEPAAPSQHHPGTWEAVPVGGTLPSRDGIGFRSPVYDDDGDAVRLEVRVRRIGGAFGDGPDAVSIPFPSGGGSLLTLPLPPGTYVWEARTSDELGGTTDWVAFGGNGDSEGDFTIVPEGSSGPSRPCSQGAAVPGGPPVLAFALLSAGAALSSCVPPFRGR